MQTFLPYHNFEQTAMILDYRRLGKQRVECWQILKAIMDPTYGWQNHPAVNMWRGHLWSLYNYSKAICSEWTRRGYKDNMLNRIADTLPKMYYFENPVWLGDEEFHLSHQSNLIRKKPEFYKPIFGDSIPDNLPYVWPVELGIK